MCKHFGSGRLSAAIVLAVLAGGCQWNRGPANSPGYETVARDPQRNTAAAQEHCARGAALVKEGRLDGAEKEFKSALAADVFFGPAHNNLGLVYYKEKKLYLAAWEFQYASKLLPNKAEPKSNLGMVLESVGKLDQAAKSYEEALAIDPDSAIVVGNLARVYVREGRKDGKARQFLTDVVMKDSRPEWAQWAKDRLTRMGQPASAPAGGAGAGPSGALEPGD